MTDRSSLEQVIAQRQEALDRVRRVLIERLKVPLAPEEIDLDAPLFGTGIGLDSVDAVELVVAIESEFQKRMPEDKVGPWAFRTVHALVDFVLSEDAVASPVPVGGDVA